LDEFVRTLSNAVVGVGIFGGMKFPSDDRQQSDIHDAFATAYEAVEKDIPEIKRQLEEEFGAMLGESLTKRAEA
jgi:hypothetical protein